MHIMRRKIMANRISGMTVTLGIIGLGLAASIRAQSKYASDSVVVDGHLHTPGQILKLSMDSKLAYELAVWSDSIMPQDTAQPIVLPPMLWPKIVDRHPQYTMQTLPDSIKTLMNATEAAYGERKLDSAMLLYLLILKAAPDFAQTKTFMGDVFFLRGEYDSAIALYREVIEVNPADYQTHWFLGNALAKVGDSSEALSELTTAHILNVHHKALKEVLVDFRARIGKPWKEWEFTPRYEIRRTSDRISILCDTTSLLYGLVKAFWAYEPGYAEKMRDTADITDRLLNLKEESEAVSCAVYANDSLRAILFEPIVKDNLTQFALYEVIAKRDPALMLHLDEISRDFLVEYLNRFH